MISNLPLEICDHLFSYCSIDDLLNVASCSKSHYSHLKYLRWRTVMIPQNFLQDEDLPEFTKNIRYSVSLILYQEGDSDCDEERSASWKKIGFNFAKLLNYCNSERLTKLRISGVVTAAGIRYTMEVLCNIQELDLVNIRQINWENISSLEKLTKLSLESCDIDDDGVKYVLMRRKLDELHLEHCLEITDETLVCISNATNLKMLTVCGRFSEDRWKLLGKLKNLVFLDISKGKINDNIIIHLCQTLKGLKTLKLGWGITDNGLSQINLLSSLTVLILRPSCSITHNSFVYISSLTSLYKIVFTARICADGMLLGTLSHLNDCSTLKEIAIVDIDIDSLAIKKILKVLCHEDTWRLKITAGFLYVLSR